MNLLKASVAGLMGTAVMTGYSYYLSNKKKKEMKIPEILGTMLTDETGKKGEVSHTPEALIIGNLAHFSVGTFFAISYDLLWSKDVGKPNLQNGLLFGLANGLVGMGVWRSFIAVHNDPPKLPVKSFIGHLLPAHLIFAVSTVAAYKLMNKD